MLRFEAMEAQMAPHFSYYEHDFVYYVHNVKICNSNGYKIILQAQRFRKKKNHFNLESNMVCYLISHSIIHLFIHSCRFRGLFSLQRIIDHFIVIYSRLTHASVIVILLNEFIVHLILLM